jgi:hypothetical protein
MPNIVSQSACAGRQWKIYTKQIHANFRRFNRVANTCSLSTAANFDLNCNKSQRASKKDQTGIAMFFLLRMAFWLGLVLVLLPRDKTPDSEKMPQIGASDAVSAASAAMSDMSQFCKRQPAACEVGGQAATVIGVRAQDGARKVYQSITDKKAPEADKNKKAPDHTGSIGLADNAEPAAIEMAPRDTLSSDDLAVEWRGGAP